MPGIGQFLSFADVAFVDRGSTAQAKPALAPAVEKLRAGVSLVIAPEGTRSYTRGSARSRRAHSNWPYDGCKSSRPIPVAALRADPTTPKVVRHECWRHRAVRVGPRTQDVGVRLDDLADRGRRPAAQHSRPHRGTRLRPGCGSCRRARLGNPRGAQVAAACRRAGAAGRARGLVDGPELRFALSLPQGAASPTGEPRRRRPDGRKPHQRGALRRPGR